jgi:hypothetical protein
MSSKIKIYKGAVTAGGKQTVHLFQVAPDWIRLNPGQSKSLPQATRRVAGSNLLYVAILATKQLKILPAMRESVL